MSVMMWRVSGFVLIAGLIATPAARAQHAPDAVADATPSLPSLAAISLPPLQEIPVHLDLSRPALDLTGARHSSSAVAPSLAIYAAYGMLQVLDVHSTLRALDHRAAEANPLIRSIVSSPAGLIALKTASTTGILYLVERVRRKNPTAALVFSIVASSVQAYVVAHNYRVARRR